MAEAVEKNKENYCEIIIIGAGMGGISAAVTLLKNGMTDFKIIEASDKIGGRIEALETGNLKLEMGANYIHGILGNPIYELALSHGLIDITHSPKPHNVVAAMEDGSQAPFSVLQEIYEAYVCFLRRCEEYFMSEYLPPEGISSVGDHIKLEAALYLDKVKDNKEKHVKQLIFNCLLKRETCITGCDDMNEVDLIELGSYIELQGGNVVLPCGYSGLIDAVASEIPPENMILSHPVSAIYWTPEGCPGDYFQGSGYDSGIDLLANGDMNNDSDSDKTITEDTSAFQRSSPSSRSRAEKIVEKDEEDEHFSESVAEKPSEVSDSNKSTLVEVVCENGEKFYANHVICTIPLGVLKEKADTMFIPKLPQDKLDSIKKLSFGTVDKIYLEYPNSFLHSNVSEIMLLWDDENDADEGDGNLEDRWYKKIYSFSKLTDTLVLGWISGKEARFMESLPDKVVGEKCTEILRKFLNDPYIPMPKLCTFSKWHSNERFRGSYTSIAMGATQLDIRRIARPLCAYSHQKKPVLLFAGEHTHGNFYSTVHGAYLSGKSAAEILLANNSDSDEFHEGEDEGVEETSSRPR